MNHSSKSNLIFFYDGTCGLCHNTVKLLISLDKKGLIQYAPLQGTTAERFRSEGTKLPTDLAEVILFKNGVLYGGQGAILESFQSIGGVMARWAGIMKIIPTFLRDWGYRFVAKIRYKIWGKRDELCPLMPPELRARFLD